METELDISQAVVNEGEVPSRGLALFGWVGLLVVFMTSFLFSLPELDYFTICGFKNFTGLPCPGCGLTHSFCALGKGHVADAFGFNLLGPPLFLALILLWIRSGFVLLNKTAAVGRLDQIAGRFKIVRAFAIGFAVYGIARIGYLMANDPVAFRNSPLSQLIGRFTP